MGFLFDFLGSIFGYILWFFFDAVGNYAIAIVLFTLVINVVMFPLAIKRQKTMAMNSRLSKKQQELRKKYEKDQKRYNEELALLYEKEGVSPMNGCFSTMLLPLILWSGVFGAITKPLQNTLHIASDKVSQATSMLTTIPAVGATFHQGYEQLQVVKLFDGIKEHLTMFSPEELSDISEFSSGFNLFGLNLLGRPNTSSLSEMLWIIPLFCFLSSVFSMYITQRINNTQPQLQGCAKYMPYAMFLFTAYIAYTIPGAVGLYWIINALVGIIQTLILNRFYNAYTLNAKDEAARVALLEINESKTEMLRNPDEVKKELEDMVNNRDFKPKDKGKKRNHK